MKLPGGEQAVVDVEKLRAYCLDRSHPRGRHKARVFAAALGLSGEDAEFLRDELLAAARENEARRGRSDEHGERYTVDLEVERGERRSTVRSAWIIRAEEQVPTADELLCIMEVRCDVADIELLSVVALLDDLPEQGLDRGQVGTIVENLGPEVYEVEFSDDHGQTYASLALRREQLLKLHHERRHQAA